MHFHFLEYRETWRGDEQQKEAVRDAFKIWKELGPDGIGLQFGEVEAPSEMEICIGFEPGGSWSYVGRDSIDRVPDPPEVEVVFELQE